MKKLFIKSLMFLFIIVAILISILDYYGGRVDSFYLKFTTPKTKSMIIGDSGSLEGIMPSIIDKKLNGYNFETPMFNYSFTIAQASIGPLYRKSILKKLDPSSKNGLFIISIHPIMLMSKNGNNNYNYEFEEADQPPHNMCYIDVNPNFEYLIKNYNFFHFKALFRNKLLLHKDGWLQDNNIPKTNSDFENRRQIWLNSYGKFSTNFSISQYRLKSLDTLVRNLKAHGSVYIIRMPIDKLFLPLEDNMYPNFNEVIDSLASSNNIKFFKFDTVKDSDLYKTLDGVHLNKYSSEIFSANLCDSIINHIK